MTIKSVSSRTAHPSSSALRRNACMRYHPDNKCVCVQRWLRSQYIKNETAARASIRIYYILSSFCVSPSAAASDTESSENRR